MSTLTLLVSYDFPKEILIQWVFPGRKIICHKCVKRKNSAKVMQEGKVRLRSREIGKQGEVGEAARCVSEEGGEKTEDEGGGRKQILICNFYYKKFLK